MAISNAMYPPSQSFTNTVNLRAQFDKLQLQLATGEKYSSLSEVGSQRTLDYNIRSRLSQLDIYSSNITTANLRLDFLDNAITTLDKIEADSRSAVVGGTPGQDQLRMVTAQSLAEARLNEVLSILGSDLNGRYVFSGDKADVVPVVTGKMLLDGDLTRDGLRTIVSQRNQADMGADSKGRLVTGLSSLTSSTAASTNTITLTGGNSVADANGVKLKGVTSTTSVPGAIDVRVSPPIPTTDEVDFSTPVAGDTVRITMQLADGSFQDTTYTAVAAPTVPAANEFLIGATDADTKANFLAVATPAGVQMSSITPTAATIGAVTVSTPPPAPTTNGVDFATPAAGDSVRITMKMADGSFQDNVYTAVASPTVPAANEFLIGATDADTKANFLAVATPAGAEVSSITPTSVTPGAVSVEASVAAPGSSDIAFTAPVDGDKVTVTVELPDGSTQDRELTAVTPVVGTPLGPNEFAIGVDDDETAANFKAALDGLTSGGSITLSEDGVHDFGLTLNELSTTSAGISVTQPSGTPATMSFQVNAQPEKDDRITFKFVLPDGVETSFDLQAVPAGQTPGENQFEIGADLATTSANIKSALDASLVRLGKSEVQAASTYLASDNFINGNGESVMRVDGPDYATATTMSVASATDTVLWYTGGESSGNPRHSVQTRVDNSTVASYGVEGNESGFVELVRALGAMAVTEFRSADDDAVARYQAMASEQYERLSDTHNAQAGSIEVIALELGIAKVTAGDAGQRQKTYGAQLETMLAEVEAAPIEEVAASILSVQTRIEASYKSMSIISQLSLVDYI